MKYRCIVVHDLTVEADTPAQAEALALAEVEDGLCITYGVQVELLDRERDE